MPIAHRAIVTWLAIWLLVLDVVAAAQIRPEAAPVLDPTQVCSVGGMSRPADGPSPLPDHVQCVFCLPLAHVGSAAPVSSLVLAAPLGMPLGRAETSRGEALVRIAVTVPPARAPPAMVRVTA